MVIKLPQFLEDFFHALNTYNMDLLLKCFSEDIVMHDEGKEYQGATAIAKHLAVANNQRQVKTEVTDITLQNGETIVTAIVSGNFEGSPVSLDFAFSFKGKRITRINII